MGTKAMEKRIKAGHDASDKVAKMNKTAIKVDGKLGAKSYLLDGGIREDEMDAIIDLYKEGKETALSELDLKKLRELFIEVVDIKTRFNGPTFVPAKYVASKCKEFSSFVDHADGLGVRKLEYNGK